MLVLAALSAIGAGGAAGAGPSVATIDIKGMGSNLRFAGDKEAQPGAQLEINNLTDPNVDGPHTFSLVTKKALPDTAKKRKKCEQVKLKVCERILEAHDPFGMTTKDLDNGALGWDRGFSGSGNGDSWYTDLEDEGTSRAISAEPGTKLRYFCVVHPFMKGKLQVLPEEM